MILKIKDEKNKIQKTKSKKQQWSHWTLDLGFWTLRILTASLFILLFSYSTCKYSFKDSAPIPQEVKTFRVNYLTNKAGYVNPQLSPLLTEAVKQKIISNTRLHQVDDDSAQYDISGYVSNYSVTTTGISGNTPSQNRLTVTVHLIFKDKQDDSKSFENDVTNNFDFSASQTLSDAESTLTPTIITTLTDAIFNKIFSNW